MCLRRTKRKYDFSLPSHTSIWFAFAIALLWCGWEMDSMWPRVCSRCIATTATMRQLKVCMQKMHTTARSYRNKHHCYLLRPYHMCCLNNLIFVHCTITHTRITRKHNIGQVFAFSGLAFNLDLKFTRFALGLLLTVNVYNDTSGSGVHIHTYITLPCDTKNIVHRVSLITFYSHCSLSASICTYQPSHPAHSLAQTIRVLILFDLCFIRNF